MTWRLQNLLATEKVLTVVNMPWRQIVYASERSEPEYETVNEPWALVEYTTQEPEADRFRNVRHVELRKMEWTDAPV